MTFWKSENHYLNIGKTRSVLLWKQNSEIRKWLSNMLNKSFRKSENHFRNIRKTYSSRIRRRNSANYHSWYTYNSSFFTELNHLSVLEKRIVGGSIVASGEKKYVASFRRDRIHTCTCCLISSLHALTAARCLKDFLIHEQIPNFDRYSVVVGSLSLFEGSNKDIAEVEVPRVYNFSDYSGHDIGLITVDY